MDLNKILNSVRRVLDKIYEQEELVRYYDRMSYSIGSQSCDGGFHDGCNRNREAPFEKWLSKKSNALIKLKNLKEELKKCQDEVKGILENVDKLDDRLVLNLRYVEGYSWNEIASELGISLTTAYRRHREGLKSLKNVTF